ncbi:MAG: glycine cleavage T C-terminal barrel domain-containing protein, partial [Kiloniellales bacterium]|nr:glycine cleavage T C-terminal barrel domain-containing protein [Kiloniellales bacterium]
DNWVLARTIEACSKHYTMAWPHEEHESGRPRLLSPLYERLKARNACFGSKLGWERPNWFAPEGVAPEDHYSFGRQNWFSHVGEEHIACRERVALFDQSSFAKFELRGPDAAEAIDWVAANDMRKPLGSVIYTQLLNSRGCIECDLTAARIADDCFYIVTGTGFRTHDQAWIKGNIPEGLDADLIDITEEWGTLSLMGPKSRDLLATLIAPDQLSNESFPFATWKEVMIANRRVRALRITYMGELGWELHMPIAATGDVFDAIEEAGKPFGLALAGYRAIESLRLEKGYRAWGSDITPNDSPFEAGLGWAVKLRSGRPFLGREAAEKAANSPRQKMLACFTVDDQTIVLQGRETIFRNGRPVGYITSAGWGYSLQKNIAYGYVRSESNLDRDYLAEGSYELEAACERIPCRIHIEPLYDPKMQRVKS